MWALAQRICTGDADRLLVVARRPPGSDELIATANKLTRRPGDRSRLPKAARPYRAAFRLGDATAAYNLACTYQNLGEHRAVVRWYRRTLAAGDLSALWPLAEAELYGLGTERDAVDALVTKLTRLADEDITTRRSRASRRWFSSRVATWRVG